MGSTSPRAITSELPGDAEAASRRQMAIESWLMDMDGVLVDEAVALPGADRFLNACASTARATRRVAPKKAGISKLCTANES